MTFVWTVCGWVGAAVLSCCTLLALLILWLAVLAPRVFARRDRRRAIERVIEESRFYLSTHPHA